MTRTCQTGLARRAFAPLLETARKHARALADERKRERMIELERLQQEEARRIAREREQRDAVAAVRRIELDDRAARERACQPYLDLVRGAMRGGDPLPLAERLMRLEQLVEALRR